jgi:hypothetical protein
MFCSVRYIYIYTCMSLLTHIIQYTFGKLSQEKRRWLLCCCCNNYPLTLDNYLCLLTLLLSPFYLPKAIIWAYFWALLKSHKIFTLEYIEDMTYNTLRCIKWLYILWEWRMDSLVNTALIGDIIYLSFTFVYV